MSETKDPQQRAGQALVRLMALVARLRAPDGCPWDRRQTLESVAPYLLEESFEAVEAVESGTPQNACEELGDVAFQVVFLAHLYAEEGAFDLAQALEQVEAKMIRRHPHVFGDQKAASAEEVRGLWGRIKAAERQGRAQGLLDSVPRTTPALVRAHRLGQRAARVEFDWPHAQAVWQKVREELAELEAAATPQEQEQELGDLLFALAQWARHQGIGAEAALRRANARFQRRFQAMEEMAARQGRSLQELDPEEMNRLWEEAKAGEKTSTP